MARISRKTRVTTAPFAKRSQHTIDACSLYHENPSAYRFIRVVVRLSVLMADWWHGLVSAAKIEGAKVDSACRDFWLKDGRQRLRFLPHLVACPVKLRRIDRWNVELRQRCGDLVVTEFGSQRIQEAANCEFCSAIEGLQWHGSVGEGRSDTERSPLGPGIRRPLPPACSAHMAATRRHSCCGQIPRRSLGPRRRPPQ
jgi:hypothetical protein